MSQSTKPHTFNPPTVPTPPPTYNQVSITPLHPTTKLITLAGQVGINHTTTTVPPSLLDQVPIAYTNLLNALQSANATPRDIIHVRHYIVQDSRDATLNAKNILDRGWGRLWEEFMDANGEGHRPPDTVLGVAGLATGELLYEVECWALVTG